MKLPNCGNPLENVPKYTEAFILGSFHWIPMGSQRSQPTRLQCQRRSSQNPGLQNAGLPMLDITDIRSTVKAMGTSWANPNISISSSEHQVNPSESLWITRILICSDGAFIAFPSFWPQASTRHRLVPLWFAPLRGRRQCHFFDFPWHWDLPGGGSLDSGAFHSQM